MARITSSTSTSPPALSGRRARPARARSAPRPLASPSTSPRRTSSTTSTTGRTPPDAAGTRAMSDAALEALVRRDRIVVGAALAVLVVVASLYLRHLASAMTDMAMPDMPSMPGMVMTMPAWSWVETGALVVMWVVMMIAMMTPSAAPMILMFATIQRRRAAEGRTAVPTAVFVLAYLVVWVIFSVVAAVMQAGLHAVALLSPAMAATSPWLAGGL